MLPFLERMLELNFGAAGAAVQAGNREAAQQHVAVIQAALAAANTYAGAGQRCCTGLLGVRRWVVGLALVCLCKLRPNPLLLAARRAEWVPVGRLLDAGLINACGYMLNTTEFRDAACDVMRQVAGACRRSRRMCAHVHGAWLRRRPDAMQLCVLQLLGSDGAECAGGEYCGIWLQTSRTSPPPLFPQGASRARRRPRCSEP